MRRRDRSLTNDEIFAVVADRLSLVKDAHPYKKAVLGLFCFMSIIWALSTLGTAFASAILCRTRRLSTMTNVDTGELMAVQTAGDTNDIKGQRRQLVFDSLEANPFHVSQADRRMRKCRDVCDPYSCLCDGTLFLDNNYMTDAEFRELTTKWENKEVFNIFAGSAQLTRRFGLPLQ